MLHGRSVEQDRVLSVPGLLRDACRSSSARSDTGSRRREHPTSRTSRPSWSRSFPSLGEIGELRSAARPDRRPRAPAGPKVEERTCVFELIARTLTRIAGGRPLVLVLEDLHGAEISIDALQYVVRRLGPTPTLVVGTYRSTEVDARHPLVRMLEGSGTTRASA